MLELLQHPPIPISLLGINPRRLVPYEWDAIRADALAHANARCVVCGSDERLEVHETYVYDYEGHIATYVTAFPLCVSCHRFVHLEITTSRWLNGDLTTEAIISVANHGATLLSRAGMMATTCQLYQMYRLSWWPDVVVNDDVLRLVNLAWRGLSWIPDMDQWRLQWRGDLYKEVIEHEYLFDVVSLGKNL